MDTADFALGRGLLQRPPRDGDAELPRRAGQTHEARQTDGAEDVTSDDISVELDVRHCYFAPHKSYVERVLGHVLDVLPDHILDDAYHRLFRHGGNLLRVGRSCRVASSTSTSASYVVTT